MMNVLTISQIWQVCKKKNYNCQKSNHNAEIISRKRLGKIDNCLVVKINQIQAYHFSKTKDNKSAKMDNAAGKVLKVKA